MPAARRSCCEPSRSSIEARPSELAAGVKLGPYEVVSVIGSGGMGSVYRAKDARLNRDVAIKASTAQFSQRFEREAKTVAALNHPNICQIYDVGPPVKRDGNYMSEKSPMVRTPPHHI
jgi:serine/threonine protein kinase